MSANRVNWRFVISLIWAFVARTQSALANRVMVAAICVACMIHGALDAIGVPTLINDTYAVRRTDFRRAAQAKLSGKPIDTFDSIKLGKQDSNNVMNRMHLGNTKRMPGCVLAVLTCV